MNFYNEDEDKKGAPVIPGTASPFKKTSAFGKTPMFSRATGGIIDRLKNLSRKDMAFVGIGLSVLVMAPVAEYMMSQPAQDNLLRETFNPRSGPGSIMDPGINGLSTGSSDGSGEVITPLSARDPMSLILGAQPAAAAMPPPSAPPTTNYRDAMKESGRAAFTEAAKSAGAPTVIPRMQSALRGISSFGGDSGGSRTSGVLGGGKIIDDARSASSKAKSRSMVGPVAMAGYKGVASNTPNSSSKGAFEKLRAQADRSAGNFSGGSAMTSLDKAAADAANISGAGGLGAGGDSEKTGKTSGSTTKYDHNRSGETLAEAAAKARQAKELEWEFFKKYEFKKQLLTAVFGAVSTEVGKWVGGTIKGIIDPAPAPGPTQYCWKQGAGGACYPAFAQSMCKDDKGGGNSICNACVWFGSKDATPPAGVGCNNPPPPAPAPDPVTDPGTGPGPAPSPAAQSFDDWFGTLRSGTIKEAEGLGDKPVEFAAKSVAAVNSFSELASEGKDYSFPGMVKATLSKTAEFNGRLNAYNMKVQTASGALRALKSQNEALIAALNSADKSAIAKRQGAKATERQAVQAEILTDLPANAEVGTVNTQIAAYLKTTGDFNTQIIGWEGRLGFLERAGAVCGKQAELVSAAAGDLKTKSGTLAGDAQGLLPDLQATPPDNKKLGDAFVKFTGIPVKVGEDTPAAADNSKVDGLVLMRGADKDKYWKSAKVDDSALKTAETEAWGKISPKLRMNDYTSQLPSPDAIEENLKAYASLNQRAVSELPGDLTALEGDLNGVYKGDGNGILEVRKRDFDAFKATVEAYLGPGAVIPPPVVPSLPGANSAALARSDAALTAGSGLISANQPTMDSIAAAAPRHCKSDECKEQLGNARTAMQDMNRLQGEISGLRDRATAKDVTPAELQLIESQVAQKQRDMQAADTRFRAAAKRVGALEAIRPVVPVVNPPVIPQPPTGPTQAELDKRADIAKADAMVRAIDACYSATSGFKGQALLCRQQLATRTATTVLTARAFKADIAGSDDQAFRNTYLGYLDRDRNAAYNWASSCRFTMPQACTLR